MPGTATVTTLKRRWADTLRDVDGLLEAHLRDAHLGGRPLANLAAAMAIEYSDADRGALMVDEGKGFQPVLALESDLSPSGQRKNGYDLELVDQAGAERRTTARGRSVASPVLLDQLVKCVLYLERDHGQLDPDTIELADGIATRIGALLRSAALVEELARRNQNMTTLEALGACLAAGQLHQKHLDRAVEGALKATGSDDAILTLLDTQSGTPSSTLRGESNGDLRRCAVDWIQRIEQGALTGLDDAIDGPCLIEPLLADLVPQGVGERRAVGFLATRRKAGRPDYDDVDRSFFRAVAHLLSGALARLEYFNQAAEDPLTETGSRLALQLGLAEAQSHSRKTGRPFSLALVDIDNFKEINDLHGHMAGDEVLQAVAALLRSRLRTTDSVHRYGGDEFVLILPQTEKGQATGLGEELRALVGRRALTDDEVDATISVGVATFSPHADDHRRVLGAADDALYRSKSLGRNRVTHADDLGAS
jgi:diguanylate cyclase (GGDEF)-like protein